MPFDQKNLTRLLRHQLARQMIEDPDIKKELSIPCREVINICLIPDQNERPDIEGVFNTEWIQAIVLRNNNANS